ncbi:hypothetical protein SAMN05518672_10241 [Chitinophaga sp. CF118]|uniref:hypothetical protein n=1 Tax=Chitinophaga sp. CF118 TaxID=1884367 RepID=UPI0008E1FDAC|nr:hypothetical protein [Chitinophaga sp. CF118]SFD46136.1 hypothetical protein SAMN05518672_10241 [Chitinophaga sp. CF118]
MRTLSLLFIFTLFQVLTFAQFNVIAEGPLFEEPESGYARILQMKNGNTLCLYISQEETIDVSIYGADHMRKVQKHLKPALGKSRGFRINSIFEIAGEAVLFISEINDKHPALYRVQIDGNTGELKNEDKIAEADRYSSKFRSIIPEFRPDSSFFIRKDPNSDYYGLVILHRNDNSAGKRAIEVVLYDSMHKEVNKNFYVPPFQHYRYFDYLDMAVMGGEKLSIIGFAYDQVAEDYKDGHLVISNLDKGIDHMIANDVPVRDGQIVDSACVKFNPLTKKLLLLGASHAQGTRKEQYDGFLAILDPYTQKVDKEVNIYPEKVNTRKKELFGQKQAFTGMPQQLFIEDDGGFSIAYEELTHSVITSLNSGPYVYCFMNSAAIALFDVTGKEISSSLIPKSQVMRELEVSSFYLSERINSAQKLAKGDQYKSFMFLDGKEKKYALLNDVEDNAESIKKGHITTIRALGECNGFYYSLDGSNVLPERNFIFGKPAKENFSNLALFTVSDYDRENNIFITLKVERRGKQRNARLVWLKP